MIDKGGKKTKVVLKEFKLDEISAVDSPAQAPARVSLLKRQETLEKLKPGKGESKDDFISRFMSDEGMKREYPDQDQRLAVANSMFEQKMGKKEPEEQAPASSEDNAKAGTVHKSGENPMNEDEKKQLEELAKKLAKAEAILALSAEQRAHYDGLAGDAQDEFLGKSAEDRESIVKAELAKANDENSVVYTDSEGTEFRKSDDPRLVAMAKRADEERKARIEAETLRKADELAKRAGEFQHLPGEQETKVELLKAVDSIKGEAREKVMEMLKAHDGGLKNAFEKKGTTEGKSSGDPKSEFEELVKKLREEDKTLTEAKAMVKVLETEEGARLHAKMNGR